jgi:hypothetical protein
MMIRKEEKAAKIPEMILLTTTILHNQSGVPLINVAFAR